MKYLVTGGSGFIGSHFAEFLKTNKHKVKTLDLENADFNIDLTDCRFDDILESAISNCDVVCHFASPIGVGNILKNVSKTFDDAIVMNAKILKYCKAYNKRIIFTSSSEVYGNSAIFKESESLSISPKLRSSYAIQKLAMEFQIRTFLKDFLILRPFNIVGIGQNKEKSVLAKWCYLAQNNKNLTVYSPFAIRSFCDISDFCDIVYQLESQKKIGIFNVGCEFNNTNMRNLAEYICDFYYVDYCTKDPKSVFGDEFYEIQYRVPDMELTLNNVEKTDFVSLKDIIKSL